MSTSTLQDDAVTNKTPARPLSTPAAATPADPIDPVATPGPSPAAKPPTLLQRYRKPALIVGGIVAAIAIAFYAFDAFTHEETDDAYVTGHLHNVSARIAETVTDVLVDDNQFVHQGDVLVKLDPSDYLALEMAAKSNLAKAEADLKPRDSAAGDARVFTAGHRCGEEHAGCGPGAGEAGRIADRLRDDPRAGGWLYWEEERGDWETAFRPDRR